MSPVSYHPIPDEPEMQPQGPPLYRIAIVGCGPRGLFCLAELREQIRCCRLSIPLEIRIFEPSDSPGAGVVYDPQQPHFLRMNFAANHIDAWRKSASRAAHRRGLVDWLRHRGDININDDSYLPRAVVGEYLKHCLTDVLQSLASAATIIIEHEKICSIAPHASRWQLSAERATWVADEVLLTVGHEGWRSPPQISEQSPTPLLNVFPTDPLTRVEAVPADAIVAVRGFGLTAIDGILALTEGRGGRFEHDSFENGRFENDSLENASLENHSGRLRYVASGLEPMRIVPFSRTGRPMLAKPVESLLQLPSSLADLWSEARQQLRSLTSPLGPDAVKTKLWQPLLNTAASALRICSQDLRQLCPAADDVDNWFKRWSQSSPTHAETKELLRESVAVARGKRPVDIPWALGETWRKLYPALVEQVNHGGLSAADWDVFSPLALEMERIAFGPPAENIQRLLALADAKILDLSCLQGVLSGSANEGLRLESRASVVEVDVLINGVLASPFACDPTGPLADLLASRRIRRLHGRFGIEVDPTGAPANSEVASLPGLSILGRSTEGCILGNDTLSRELHPHPQRWAQSAVRRLLSFERNRAHAYQSTSQA